MRVHLSPCSMYLSNYVIRQFASGFFCSLLLWPLVAIASPSDTEWHNLYNLIQDTQSDQSLAAAKQALDDLSPKPGRDAYKFYFLMQLALRQADPEAAREYSEIITDQHLYGIALAHIAKYYQANSNTQLAIQFYEKIVANSQDESMLTQAYAALWQLYHQAQQSDDAFRIMTTWLSDLPHTVDHRARRDQWSPPDNKQAYLTYLVGVSYYHQRRYDKAIHHLASISRTASNYTEAQIYLGLSYYFNYDFHNSIRVLKPLPKDKLLDYNALIYIARSYQRLGQSIASLPYFKQVLGTRSIYKANALYYLHMLSPKPSDQDKYKALLHRHYPQSDFITKIIWEDIEPALMAKDWVKATALLSDYKTALPAKLLFWKAKINHILDPSDTDLLHVVRDTFPSTYYAYRATVILQESPPPLDHTASNLIPLSDEHKFLVSLGLSDLVRQKIEASQADLDEPDYVYQLSYIHSLMGNHRDAILAIREHYDHVYYPPKDARLDHRLQPVLYPRPYRDLVTRYATAYTIPEPIVYAIMREESLFNTAAISRANARGLMQIMPATGKALSKDLKLSWPGDTVLHDPARNIQLGCYYLSKLYKQFKSWPLAIMAYNAGPYKVSQWQSTYPESRNDSDLLILSIPYPETYHYVKHVLQSYFMYTRLSVAAL